MIDWSIDWREWFDIQEPDSAALIDWSRCPDAESVPDRCSGAWVVKDTRVMVQGILDNAVAGCIPEQISAEIFRSVTGNRCGGYCALPTRADRHHLSSAALAVVAARL